MLPPNFTLLQVIPELETGGAEQTAIDVAAAVVAQGGRALLAARGGRMIDQLGAVGGEFIELPVHTKNPFILAENARRLEALVKKEAVSLVHARSRAPAFSALAAARRTNVPFVATYHGVYAARTPWKRWYNSVMTRGDLVIANSEYTRSHLIREHGTDPAKVVAIPRGVDLQRFSPNVVSCKRTLAVRGAWGLTPNEQRPVFLLGGRLTRWKGQRLAIDALARSRADAVLVLAGDHQGRTEYLDELHEAARPLDDRVRIVGHCSDMPAAYLVADVAIAPSLEPEAFGRTAVEPQAMLRPVLAADHGATAETVDDGVTGRRIRPGDVDAWASALAEAAAWSAERRAAMGAAGRERVERLFSVERMQQATLSAYVRVLDGRA